MILSFFPLGTSCLGHVVTVLAVTGEIVALSQPVVAVVCRKEDVYVADEHLEVEITRGNEHASLDVFLLV